MFLSILLPLSQNLTPSLRTTSYVHESRRWQTFSLFALSELVCNKNVIHPILLFPTFSPEASSPLEHYRRTDGRTDGRTTFFTPCSLTSSFFHWACGALPAGATLLGWPRFLLFVNQFLAVVRQKKILVIFGIWTRDQNLACNHRVTPPPPHHLHQEP